MIQLKNLINFHNNYMIPVLVDSASRKLNHSNQITELRQPRKNIKQPEPNHKSKHFTLRLPLQAQGLSKLFIESSS